jgi:hypothetical protein
MVMLKDKGSEALEELMNEAQLIATTLMRKIGEMSATLFIHGSEGKTIFRPKSMNSEAAKDQFVEESRIMCIAHGADAVVYCSEAWMLTPKTDKPLDLSVAPSKSPDRQEVLIFIGESREGHIHKSLPIVRAEGGKFAGFGEATEIRPDSVRGRFAQFLPEMMPTEEDRKIAMLYLAAKGIVPAEKRDKYREQGRAMF